MAYETIKIEEMSESCGREDYAKKYQTDPRRSPLWPAKAPVPKAKSRRESRQPRRPGNSVRTAWAAPSRRTAGRECSSRRSKPAIAIEGCFTSCASRMMRGVLPGLKPEIVQADTYYGICSALRDRRSFARKSCKSDACIVAQAVLGNIMIRPGIIRSRISAKRVGPSRVRHR